jgi:hypothetical protein
MVENWAQFYEEIRVWIEDSLPCKITILGNKGPVVDDLVLFARPAVFDGYMAERKRDSEAAALLPTSLAQRSGRTVRLASLRILDNAQGNSTVASGKRR